MFTLKLYQNNDRMNDRIVIIECAGVWVDQCDNSVKHIRAFQKVVGVQDEGEHEYYVGGAPAPNQDSISNGPYGNWYAWGVLENANGKTTEMFR